MTTQELIHYIQHPEYLRAEHVSSIQQLCKQYPYCAAFAILLAKNLDNIQDIQARQQLKKAALYAYHREVLQCIMQKPAVVEPKEEGSSAPSTVNATSNSSATTPNSTVNNAAAFTTNSLLDSIGYEFSSTNLHSTQTMQGQDLIDKFIAENPHISAVGTTIDAADEEPLAPQPEVVEPTDTVFTESLAKIYIKQKQYTKALHIFERLNLKFPEKSAYFADQISFLKKIIQTNS